MGKTQYKILRRNEDGSWDEFDDSVVEATSSDHALRVALADTPPTNGKTREIFNAVPLRSWHPRIIEFETQQKIKIG